LELLKGELVGGNLSILQFVWFAIVAIDCWIKSSAFIEDLDEYLYHIDRIDEFKTQRICLSFKRIIVGGMTKM
jgi:muramoyltetrapeptide carboxypeptidase